MDRFGLGLPELLVIAVLAFFVIGPTRIAGATKRLPQALRS